jgi:hypothetical protein
LKNPSPTERLRAFFFAFDLRLRNNCSHTSEPGAIIANLLGVIVGLVSFAGWCQHLYTCFNERLWGFLIAGALFVPIGIIHGWGIWLGWWH